MRARGGTRTGLQPLQTLGTPEKPQQSGPVPHQYDPIRSPKCAQCAHPKNGHSAQRALRQGATPLAHDQHGSGNEQAPNRHRTAPAHLLLESTSIMMAGSSSPNISWRNEQRPASPTDVVASRNAHGSPPQSSRRQRPTLPRQDVPDWLAADNAVGATVRSPVFV
jgi:hypothetical protein